MPSTPVQNNDSFLNHLQANILKGHGRDFAHHLFFQVKEGKAAQAKQWIATFAATEVTTATKQLNDTAALHAGTIKDGGTLITLSLTAKGYKALGLLTSMPTDAAFRGGMAAKAGVLGDKPANLEEPFKQPVHLFIIVADDNPNIAKVKSDGIINNTQSFLTLIVNQRGNILKMKGGLGIEHFSYADGISQPLFLANDINRQPTTNEWDDTTDLDRVLLPDPGTDNKDCFGSYLVFRKLEQNVKAFKLAEKSLPIIKDVKGVNNNELGGAMLVGRFENSVPVTQSSIDTIANPPIPTNDFDYRNDLTALKCPFHAHVRLMNPRNGDKQAGPLPKQRITRRGIPFDEVHRVPESDINKITEEMLEANQPDGGVGLLFMCYQSSIETQFEILQQHWANEGNIGGHVVGGQDSIIGQGTNPQKTLPAQWGQPAQTTPFSFHGFVKMKGGEYFFTPSILFLKNINT